MSTLYKYPRTPYLPWSSGTKDDRILSDDSQFHGKSVVCTVKMDGENTSMYRGHIHARSLDSGSHPSRDFVKGIWGGIRHLIEENMRICGENLFAVHSIKYFDLESYFLCFNIWRDEICLSWDETIEICSSLGISPAPVFYRGIYDPEKIKEEFKKTGDQEGYVVRIEGEFDYSDFSKNVAKYVNPVFKRKVDESTEHWQQKKVERNELRKR